MIIFLVVWLILVSSISAFIIINLLNQNKQLEREVGKDFEEVELAEQKVQVIYEFILRKLIHTKNELDRIDKNGMFSSDDDVGFSFKVIQNSIDLVVNELKQIKVVEEDESKKTK